MKRVSVLLITLALIAGMVGCPAAPVPEPPVQYSLTVLSSEGGSVTSPGEGTFTYDEGTTLSLKAVSASGYWFSGWTGDVDTIVNVQASSTTITMNGNCSITANFQVIPVAKYNLSVSSTEGGSASAPGEGTFTYDAGTVVELVAEAEEGYQFTDWTGSVGAVDDVNAGSTTVTMMGDYTITARFTKEIRNWYDLDAMRDNLSGSYVLMNDLDSTTPGYAEFAGPTANEGKGWEPVGGLLVDPASLHDIASVDPFAGNLDGSGYEIRDMFIDRSDEDGVGLLGCVSEAVIENVGVVDAKVVGHVYVGCLVGSQEASITSNCYAAGTVIGDELVGGLLGGNFGTVSQSYATGGVNGNHSVGGLLGGNFETVSDCHSTSAVTGGGSVGGLTGGNWGVVTRAYATGSVAGQGGVGGLVGWNHHGTVSDSYCTVNVTGDGSVGGMLGEIHDGTVSNSHYDYSEVLINGKSIVTTGALFGEDFDQWLANDKSLSIDERLAQEDDYYLINDVSDFKSLLAFGQDHDLKFRLSDDLDLANEPGFYIPYFSGEFDGNGHKIWNLSFDFDSVVQVGLFGYLASGGVVTGVSAENMNIAGEGYVGGLVGENAGTVSNSYSTGRIAGHRSVGGLVGSIGWNGGTVTNSYYDYDEVLINDRNTLTVGALYHEDFNEWLANGKVLDVNERLSQEDGHYLIRDVSDFRQLLAFGQDDSLRFRLTNDLDLATEPNFYIPYLAGEFDGGGHRISGLSLNSDSVAQTALFGYLAHSGKVSEVGVDDIQISATDSLQVAGLVAQNIGLVSDCYCSGSVTGMGDVGGVVGWNIGLVSDCYCSGSVTGTGDVGGLLGWNYGGTVRNSYSIGKVSGDAGDERVGGLVGVSRGTVSNSFWDVQTSGQSTSAGGTGKTTAQMKNITTFSGAGWNIMAVANPNIRNPSYIWNIVDGQTYPFLSWQSVS